MKLKVYKTVAIKGLPGKLGQTNPACSGFEDQRKQWTSALKTLGEAEVLSIVCVLEQTGGGFTGLQGREHHTRIKLAFWE